MRIMFYVTLSLLLVASAGAFFATDGNPLTILLVPMALGLLALHVSLPDTREKWITLGICSSLFVLLPLVGLMLGSRST